jgi:hypothetical protein
MSFADDSTRTNLTADEEKRLSLLDAHAALGALIGRVPMDIRIASWRIENGHIDALVSPGWEATDDDTRAILRRLAKDADLTFAETPRNDGQNLVAATGIATAPASGAEFPVKFWQLVKPCQCGCHHSAVTE